MMSFEAPERTGLDFLPDADPAPTQMRSLLTNDLEEHKDDFEIVADLLDALFRYRHLLRAVESLPELRQAGVDSTALAALSSLTDEPYRNELRRLAAVLRAC
jgi:hypothetical protein